VGTPDPLHRADADPELLGRQSGRPMGRLAWRIAQRQRHRALAHRHWQRRNPCQPRLIAQQPVNPLRHETFLPAPHGDLALAGLPHDRVGPDAVCRHQHDARSPHILLRCSDPRQSPPAAPDRRCSPQP